MASLTAQAKQKLEELKELTRLEAESLSNKQSENGRLTSENERLHSDNVNLVRANEGLRSDALGLESNIKGLDEVIRLKGGQMVKADDAESAAHFSRKEHERRQDDLIRENAALESDKKERMREIEGQDSALEALRREAKVANSEKVQAQEAARIAQMAAGKAVALKDRVMGAIDAAMQSFRLFERRIGKFSEETGYIVGYEDPGALLDNEENHE